MGHQLHAPTIVLPGNFASSSCTQGWVSPSRGLDRYEKEKLSYPYWGSNVTLQPAASWYSIYTPTPPAIQSVLVCLWHAVGENIRKILLHKDLSDTKSTFAF